MDGDRFDSLTRALGSGRSRRGMLKTLGAAALGAAGVSRLGAAVAKNGSFDNSACVNFCNAAFRKGSARSACQHAGAHGTGPCAACEASIVNYCSGTCTNVSTDATNCGACGHVCPSDACNAAICDAGVCGTTPAKHGGQCAPAPDLCTNVSTCDASGDCVAGGAVTCDDANACIHATCDPTSGGCVNTEIDCSALSTECSLGTCDVATGTCVAAPFNERGACNGGAGTCFGGACRCCQQSFFEFCGINSNQICCEYPLTAVVCCSVTGDCSTCGALHCVLSLTDSGDLGCPSDDRTLCPSGTESIGCAPYLTDVCTG